MYEIGSYLRAALKQRGMTQKELAMLLGMTKEHKARFAQIKASFS